MADTAKMPSRAEMEKYKRVKKNDQLEKEEGREDVIRISAKGRTSNYVSYAAKLFSDDPEDAVVKDEKTGEEKPVKKFDSFTIKATGQALATAVTVAEIIKRRFKGVHQQTKIGSLEVNDEYELKEAQEEDAEKKLDDTITQVRHISFIEITLSKVEPAEKDPVGYQPPLPEDQINVKSMDELIGETKGNRTSGGRGGGRGSGKGKGRNSNRGKGPKKDGEKSEGGAKSDKKDGKADAGGEEKKDGEAAKKSRNSRNRNSKKKSEGGDAAKKEGDAKSDAKKSEGKKDEKSEGGEKKNSGRGSKGKGKKGKGKGKKGKGKKGGDSDSDDE